MLVRKKHDLAKIITFAIKFNFLTLITMSSNTNQKFPWTKHFWLNVLSSTVGFIIVTCSLYYSHFFDPFFSCAAKRTRMIIKRDHQHKIHSKRNIKRPAVSIPRVC